jgi:hypothetical protein
MYQRAAIMPGATYSFAQKSRIGTTGTDNQSCEKQGAKNALCIPDKPGTISILETVANV